MWRSEDEMLEVVRQRAASRRRRYRVLTATATTCVVAVLALAVAALAGGGKPSEVRVAGSVEGGGASRGSPAPSRAAGSAEPTTTVAAPSADFPTNSTITLAPAPPSLGLTPTTLGASDPAPDTRAPEPGSVPGASPDTPVSTVVPPSNDPPSPGTNPQRVTVNSAAVDLRPRPYDSAEAYGSSSVAVRFWGGLPACEPIGRVDVQETASTVTITLYTGRVPGQPDACIAIAVYQELVVELSGPLAGRTIVDGAA